MAQRSIGSTLRCSRVLQSNPRSSGTAEGPRIPPSRWSSVRAKIVISPIGPTRQSSPKGKSGVKTVGGTRPLPVTGRSALARSNSPALASESRIKTASNLCVPGSSRSQCRRGRTDEMSGGIGLPPVITASLASHATPVSGDPARPISSSRLGHRTSLAGVGWGRGEGGEESAPQSARYPRRKWSFPCCLKNG